MFSAVLTNYQYGRFLEEALRSVLDQTPAPLEVLIVDDGSTDDSRERVKPFLDRVQWVEVPHGGQAAALNAVLPRCKGDWVAFLETDDVWTPGKLAAVAAAFEAEPDLAAVQHALVQADAKLAPLPTVLPKEPLKWTLQDYLAGTTLLTGMSGLAVKRSILDKILPLPADVYTACDELFQPRLLKLGPIRHIPGSYGLRRIHGANQYGGLRGDLKRLEAWLALRDKLDAHREAFLKENGLTLSESLRRRIASERFELELFRHRLEGRPVEALVDWVNAAGLHEEPCRAAFKALALSAALLSPKLWLALHAAYERRSART